MGLEKYKLGSFNNDWRRLSLAQDWDSVEFWTQSGTGLRLSLVQDWDSVWFQIETQSGTGLSSVPWLTFSLPSATALLKASAISILPSWLEYSIRAWDPTTWSWEWKHENEDQVTLESVLPIHGYQPPWSIYNCLRTVAGLILVLQCRMRISLRMGTRIYVPPLDTISSNTCKAMLSVTARSLGSPDVHTHL